MGVNYPAPMANAAATGIQTVQGMTPQEQPIAPPQLAQQNGGGILAQPTAARPRRTWHRWSHRSLLPDGQVLGPGA